MHFARNSLIHPFLIPSSSWYLGAWGIETVSLPAAIGWKQDDTLHESPLYHGATQGQATTICTNKHIGTDAREVNWKVKKVSLHLPCMCFGAWEGDGATWGKPTNHRGEHSNHQLFFSEAMALTTALPVVTCKKKTKKKTNQCQHLQFRFIHNLHIMSEATKAEIPCVGGCFLRKWGGAAKPSDGKL